MPAGRGPVTRRPSPATRPAGDGLGRPTLAVAVLEMVPVALTGHVGGVRPRPGIILRPPGRDVAQGEQEGPVTPPHKTKDDANDGRASDVGVVAMDVTFPVAVVATLAGGRGEPVPPRKPRRPTVVTP